MNGRTRFGFNRLAWVAVMALMGVTGGVWAQDQGQFQDQGQVQGQDQGQGQDPPDRIARVSYLRGDVSLQPASPNGDAAFAAAEVNYTLSVGDRLYTGQDGMSELESDNLALRLGRLSDVTLENFSQEYARMGLAQGSLRVRTYQLDANAGVEVDTANGSFTVLRAGDVRVSSYPGYGQRPDTTIVTVNAGQVRAVGNGFDTTIESGQVLRVDGTGDGQGQVQLVQMLPEDELDSFDRQRDELRAQAAGEIRDQYVNQGMVGYDDLAQYGEWAPEPEYGRVWYPRGVDAGWSPYHNGHWAYIAPWGYTWVEAEPWGFAPFHYGRWSQFGGRWGWVPGPVVVRPVYSPALVAFVGGGGISVTAWFPLGPREPFVPWYRASPGYVNRVNVSNIYNRNVVEVRNVYVNRTTNVYVNRNVTYVNRDRGMVAVPQRAFERGQPVRAAQVRVDPRQMQQAQVMTRPPVAAGVRPGAGVGLAPARSVPPVQARPVFQGRGQGQFGQPGNGSVGQRFGQPGRTAGGQNQPQQQAQPIRQQGQVPGAPPTRNEGRPVPGVQQPGTVQGPTPVRTPGGLRGPDASGNQTRPVQQTVPQQTQPQPQQQPGRGGRGDSFGGRPSAPSGPPAQTPAPSVPAPQQGPTVVRTPGGMRGPNAGGETPQSPANPQQQGRMPGGRDVPVTGGGGNARPAEPLGPRPSAPEQLQRGRDQGQRPPQQVTPPPQQQVRPQPTPAPQQQQVRPQERPAAPAQPQVRPQPAQGQRPAARPVERKEEPK